jgi:hypothetical protein
MTGFCPVIHARQGRMLGSRNPLDGPVFDRLQDTIAYSAGVMAITLIVGWVYPILGSNDLREWWDKEIIRRRERHRTE